MQLLFYGLDFSGDLQRDATVNIISGLGVLTIEIPAETAAQVVLSGNYRKLELEGDWMSDKNIHSTGATGKSLLINVEMDLGSLRLVRK